MDRDLNRDTALELIESQTTPRGVIIQVYRASTTYTGLVAGGRPAGRPAALMHPRAPAISPQQVAFP